MYRGVYRVGHTAPSVEARYIAAVKACGPGAVLSGLAAAYLYGLVKGEPPPPEVIARTERRIEGVATRRCRRLDRRDTTTYRRIPTTTVPKTLVLVAAVLDPEALARACHEAGVRHRTTPRQVESVLERCPNTRGATSLRAVMRGNARVTLSKLEREFLARLRSAGLPLPQTNRPAGGRRVDCRWPEHRLTVELNSYTFHNSRHAWEQDQRRAREARKRRDEFRSYTYADVVEDPRQMLVELEQLLPGPL
ncbi:MAG: hypothetical protein M3340_03300 [Actinomycetota bacterium]|nr:hypothetical protein [Actinomycetota bacterium]